MFSIHVRRKHAITFHAKYNEKKKKRNTYKFKCKILLLYYNYFSYSNLYIYVPPFFFILMHIYTRTKQIRDQKKNKYRKREKNKKFYKSVFLHTWWITLYFTRENKFSRGQIYILDAFSTSMISSTNFHPLFSLISPITSKERLREKHCFSKTNREEKIWGEKKGGGEELRTIESKYLNIPRHLVKML